MIGQSGFEIKYDIVPLSRVTRVEAGDSKNPPGIEKITGWFPCIPHRDDLKLYPQELIAKGRKNPIGTGAHFIIMEPEPGPSNN